MDPSSHVVVCNQCAFWTHPGTHDGTCRRHAPETGDSVDQVAHWPLTHHDDQCGEGLEVEKARAMPRCSECVFWRWPPKGGLQPYDRRDQLSGWWAHAGHCTRLAPRPSSALGFRAFWRVTHETDGCRDGIFK